MCNRDEDTTERVREIEIDSSVVILIRIDSLNSVVWREGEGEVLQVIDGGRERLEAALPSTRDSAARCLSIFIDFPNNFSCELSPSLSLSLFLKNFYKKRERERAHSSEASFTDSIVQL